MITLIFSIFTILPILVPKVPPNACATVCYTVDGYVAASSEKYLTAAERYLADKDYKAFKILTDAGKAVIMKGGIKVHLVDTHWGTVEFRLPGTTEVLWSLSEGIKCR